MILIAESDGLMRCVYDEAIDVGQLGSITIERASHVEPKCDRTWTADLTPVGGPLLTGFERRSKALAAEIDWLNKNWLSG
tara:strand:+ start:127097 stop:127336 length:240 start_codon:yes stop_codon:yes gene_type:complete